MDEETYWHSCGLIVDVIEWAMTILSEMICMDEPLLL